MSKFRSPVFINHKLNTEPLSSPDLSSILSFHQQLPGYATTSLIPLPELAKELQVKQVLVKNESNRFGLPSFKILGASWGTFHAIASKLGLPLSSSIQEVAHVAQSKSIKLLAATDGNHGRAVAYMAKLLSLEALIFVPAKLDEHAKAAIIEAGAKLLTSSDYDSAVQQASKMAEELPGGILIQDTSFPGYETIPASIIDGYSTMFQEMDDQLEKLGLTNSMVISPVGVGSLGYAVTRHYRLEGKGHTKIVMVEPDTAACLYTSLRVDKSVPVKTSHTIMSGMDCGTVSHTAWPVLKSHIDASVTISDFEAHSAVQYLQENGISSGPCGAAGLAALRRLAAENRNDLEMNADTVVILLNTEGSRPYLTPKDVSTDNPVTLTQILTQIESTNPSLSLSDGTGETAIADYVEAWLRHRNLESYRLEGISGRPSVIGVARGTGNGRDLMLNGHIDTVSINNYTADPLSGALAIKGGRQIITGRGSLDMKAGVAASMTAMASAKADNLKGSIILAAVADEEDASKGTQEVIAAGWRADGAVISEPTLLEMVTTHKGFVWVEVKILGVSAHGSMPEAGVDAIIKSALFLTSLDEYAKTLPVDPMVGKASLHAGLIKGGEEPSTYPESCTVTVEFRTIPVQSPESILGDLESILDQLSKIDPKLKYEKPRILLHRPPYSLSSDDPFTKTAIAAAEKALGKPVSPQALSGWCDAALLGQVGIPTVVFGPSGEGLHSKEEWVDVESIEKTESMIKYLIRDFCSN